MHDDEDFGGWRHLPCYLTYSGTNQTSVSVNTWPTHPTNDDIMVKLQKPIKDEDIAPQNL